MSAHAIDRGSVPAGRQARPGLGRLTKVELRKMVDTRSGFWLLLAVLGLSLLAVVITILAGHESDRTFRHVLANALAPTGILLPVVGILLVSSEWSQRTALVSFALVPDRKRLIAAKVLAGVVLALIATVVGIILAALGTALASADIPHVWTIPVGLLGQDFLYVVTAMVIGIGFGAALLSSAPAIVLYFGLPAGLAALAAIHSIRGTIESIDPTTALESLTGSVFGAEEWGQAALTLALWMVLPLAIGLWRITRRDIGG
ncbi:MAG: ABC transporter permease [Actinobacteria bacterium]|nr:ABC transporter permease [Actinomycetota bacterium]